MASILVICTGNVCRSPIAEGSLRASLVDRFGSGAPLVSSAGTTGWEGSAAMPESVRAARELGIDISDHRARELLADHVERADLVIGMAREHVHVVARSLPVAAARTFTLKELVRLLEGLRPLPGPVGPEALARRVQAADDLRSTGFAGNPHDEDVVDPLGMPLESYRAVAWELREWTQRLVDAMFGARADAGAGGVREGAR
jgi:protein-tyrosine phosphatase